jgi:glutathione synthase/RimK-type ligase-like ATP-grasp enzyme
MPTVAFVTCSRFPNLTDDDLLTAAILRARGITVEPVLWDSEDADWASFDLVVIRSPWDYYTRYEEFLAWLDRIEEAKAKLWNPLHIVRWNSDKEYLIDLEQHGIPIIQTILVPKGTQRSLEGVVKDRGWARAIVKPTVSAGAYETWVTDPQVASQDQSAFDKILKRSSVMIQPFMHEIVTAGEWSILFFDKQYSHSVLKVPKTGDFRVQPQYGGTPTTPPLPPALLEQAQRIVDLVDSSLLYARVDGLDVGGKFQLMELELIEPALFLKSTPGAEVRFADAIEKLLEFQAIFPIIGADLYYSTDEIVCGVE